MKDSDQDRVQRMLDAGRLRQLADKLWILGDYPIGRRKGLMVRTLLFKRPDGYYKFEVPVNKSGVIPEAAMAARMMDVEDGDREGGIRNMYVDFGINAKRRYSEKQLGDSYLWYLYPNECDIKGIDDANTRVVTILSKEQKGSGPRSVIILGGTQAQRDRVARTIQDNFTVAEKKLLAGNMIEICPLHRSIAGCYINQTQAGGYQFAGRIQLNSKYPDAFHDSMIHEAVHALRAQDKSRTGALQHRSLIGADIDLEESMTEAETVARERPFTKHKGASGYYQFLPQVKSAASIAQAQEEAVKEDRITITTPKAEKPWDSAPKKGKRAHTAVIAHYPKTNISRLAIRGRSEAIDTFFRVEEKTGRRHHVQIYAPKPTANTAKVIRAQMKAQGDNVVEYRDGKPVTIKGTGLKMMRRTSGGVVSSKERPVMRGHRKGKGKRH